MSYKINNFNFECENNCIHVYKFGRYYDFISSNYNIDETEFKNICEDWIRWE